MLHGLCVGQASKRLGQKVLQTLQKPEDLTEIFKFDPI